jgi:hypothetical protein
MLSGVGVTLRCAWCLMSYVVALLTSDCGIAGVVVCGCLFSSWGGLVIGQLVWTGLSQVVSLNVSNQDVDIRH